MRDLRSGFLGCVAVISLALSVPACGGAAASGSGADSPAEGGGKKHGKRGDDAASAGTESAAESGSDAVEAGEPALPEEGVQGEENRSMGAKMSLTLKDDSGAAAGMLDKSWALAEDRRVMVEKVGKTAVTQYSVLYGERQTRGLEGWSKLPTEGKGFTIVHQGGALAILDNGKTDATAEERKVVEAEYGFVGSANPLKLAIAKAEAGGEQALEPEAYRFLLGHVPEITISSVKIAHQGNKESGGRAVQELEVTAVGSIPDGDITYTFEIKGPATVDAKTGWPTSLVLEGKLEVAGKVTVKKKEMAASGTGQLKLERHAKIR